MNKKTAVEYGAALIIVGFVVRFYFDIRLIRSALVDTMEATTTILEKLNQDVVDEEFIDIVENNFDEPFGE